MTGWPSHYNLWASYLVTSSSGPAHRRGGCSLATCQYTLRSPYKPLAWSFNRPPVLLMRHHWCLERGRLSFRGSFLVMSIGKETAQWLGEVNRAGVLSDDVAAYLAGDLEHALRDIIQVCRSVCAFFLVVDCTFQRSHCRSLVRCEGGETRKESTADTRRHKSGSADARC